MAQGSAAGAPAQSNGEPAPCVSAKTCEQLQELHHDLVAGGQGGHGKGVWPFATYRPTVCAESDAGFSDGCATAATHQAAEALCFEIGARLCTAAELYDGVGYATGCGLNRGSHPVWSSNECESGHLTVDYDSRDVNLGRSCGSWGEGAVRCCADAEAARTGLATCDLYASEQGKCTSRLTCAELQARDGVVQGRGGQVPTWPTRNGSPDVCGESDNGLGPGNAPQCYGGSISGSRYNSAAGIAVSWQQAEMICLNAGARLCSVEEIIANEAGGTGCGADHVVN